MSRRDVCMKYFDANREFMDTVVAGEIEKNRKGFGNFLLKDKSGNPIAGAKIHIRQKNHEFRYGANLFMLDELETPEKNKIYREKFHDIANIATVPFYWDTLEPERGKPRYSEDSPRIYRRPPIERCLRFCDEQGIEPKCHCLNYDWFTPDWVKAMTVSEYKKALAFRMEDLARHFADRIPSWEVTNETFYTMDAATSQFYWEDDFVEWSFRTADKYFPANRLIINDYRIFDQQDFKGNRSAYYMQIQRLLQECPHVDSVALQFHSFQKYGTEEQLAKKRYDPVYLYKVLDQYAKLGKKLQISEMTIPAYSQDEADEDLQAELIENLYTVFFSHPAMEAIIYWNVVDGYAAFAPMGDMTSGENLYYGGLMRFDMTPKKAFHTIRRLFAEKWHTEADGETDSEGRCIIQGFYGDYDVTVELPGGKTETAAISLSKENHNRFQLTF